jgi:hypothetical protein
VRFEKEDHGTAWHPYEQWRRDGDRKPTLEIDKHGIRAQGLAGQLPLAAANSCSTSTAAPAPPFDRIGERSCDR